jgi:DMSO/TMAO reductase YedYZ heme-binding membrane subunit
MTGAITRERGGGAMKLSTPTIVLAATAAALGVGVLGFAAGGGSTQEGALMATRLTARFSFPIFLVAWSASALAALFPGGWRSALLRRRRAVGLSFAAAHGVHFGFILIAALVFQHKLNPVSVYVGGFVYVLIATMVATSNDASVKALGPARWRLLHTIGGIGIFLVFTNSYVGRLMTKPMLAWPALALIAAAVTLKLAAWLKRGRRLQAA